LLVAALFARARRVPLILWFTHWKPSVQLQFAAKLSKAVLTVDRASFPYDLPNVVPIGHGIDLGPFHCRSRELSGRLRVLALGRISPAKGLETIIRAAELA